MPRLHRDLKLPDNIATTVIGPEKIALLKRWLETPAMDRWPRSPGIILACHPCGTGDISTAQLKNFEQLGRATAIALKLNRKQLNCSRLSTLGSVSSVADPKIR